MPKQNLPNTKGNKKPFSPGKNANQAKPEVKAFEQKQGENGQQAYARWFKTLSKEEQKNLVSQGLKPEQPDGKIDSNWVFEVQPDHVAFSTNEKNKQEYDDPLPPVRLYTEDDLQETVRRVVMAMQLSEDPAVLFQARCILIAFGIGDPPTETELSKQKNCSRQFVSKKVKRIQQLFNLAPSQYMRSEEACKAYARAWQRNKDKNSPNVTDTELPL